MADKTLELKTSPADFSILASSFYAIALEMGLAMERTGKSPTFVIAHDFVSSIQRENGDMIAIAEFIPLLIGATPFATRAVLTYFGDDINEGDIFLVNDPFTLDGGNQPQDWQIVYPVFYKRRLKYIIAQKAHQMDTGGGVPGGYNPAAMDAWAEGLRLPPVRIFQHGQEIKDVFNLILTNVRAYDIQRSDLLSMIGAARIGERRLITLLDTYGERMIDDFVEDLFKYSESRMREEIERIPDGTYYGETKGVEGSPALQCDVTIKGSDITVDLRKCGPQVKQYINSPIANTVSCATLALLTSFGKEIEPQYKNSGCFKPLTVLTTPGTIAHATLPYTTGNGTIFVASQLVEIIWDALAKAIPQEIPAGWGHINYWAFSGIDPRRGERWGGPDFNACASGCGAIWSVDGLCTEGPQICSGRLYYPEIEMAESLYPLRWGKWEFPIDSGGAGRWRGGPGIDARWIADADPEPVIINWAMDDYDYACVPAIAGGKPPKPNDRWLELASGKVETSEDCRKTMMYLLHNGDKVINLTQGGCGVGNPLERDIEAVREDVRNEFVSVESARDDYGVVIDPVTFKVDEKETEKLRKEMKRSQTK